jgi:hypothetical protein
LEIIPKQLSPGVWELFLVVLPHIGLPHIMEEVFAALGCCGTILATAWVSFCVYSDEIFRTRIYYACGVPGLNFFGDCRVGAFPNNWFRDTGYGRAFARIRKSLVRVVIP